ncbi:MAG: glycosyltransferase family 4 protein [Candidatus Marsarchaeota archaeon]|nr:glycosyltransferase family 4 protein [Candidatus Marsarchaeota archaeon]
MKVKINDEKRTLFLYYNPHPSHAAMAESVGAKFYPAPRLNSDVNGVVEILKGAVQIIISVLNMPKDYDVYLCESTYIIPGIARKLGFLKNAKIVNIFASPLLYYLKTGRMKGSNRWLAMHTMNEIDGAVCIGKMEQGLLADIAPGLKSVVVYPFIEADIYRKLAKTKPSLGSHNVLTIGSGNAYYKGIDVEIAAFRRVRERFPDAKFYIVGKIEGEHLYKNEPGIIFLGRVRSIMPYIKQSSLYVQLGRGDTFPVSSLEAMLAGLPTIVSHWTGTREIVRKIDERMIVPLDPEEVARSINNYFKLNMKKKSKYSKKARRESKHFTQSKTVKGFIKRYSALVNSI